MNTPASCVRALLAAVLLVFALGCARNMLDAADMEYVSGDSYSIYTIGVCGEMSAEAALVFINAGYAAVDLGPDMMAVMNGGGAKGLRHVAFIQNVDCYKTYQYAMGVMDMHSGLSVWTSEGTYGNDDLELQTPQSTLLAVRAMVADFAKIYPPGRSAG